MSLRFVGVSGSLRAASLNTALLRAAGELVPEDVTFELSDDLRHLPLFDEDLCARGVPPAVTTWRERLTQADALVIALPEYNFSLPGPLKNGIDWASRNPAPPLFGKPLAIMGASAGMSGSMRAQYHLRQIAVYLNMHPINRPEVFVAHARAKISPEGHVTDDATRAIISEQMLALRDWTLRLKR